MSDELITALRDGCICHDRRWSGDTHDDLGGTINEGETDALMREAADRIESLESALQQQGEAVATVCLVGERYAHANMVEVQLQLAGEDSPTPKIGDRYYTHPPKPVVSDEDLRWLKDIANDLEEANGPTNNMRLDALTRTISALGVKS